MRKRLVSFCLAVLLALLMCPAQAAETDGGYVRWAELNLTCEAMERALVLEQRLREKEVPVSWLDILALGSVRSGGKRFSAQEAERAAEALAAGKSPQELLGGQYKYFSYYKSVYEAALGGLAGCYAVETKDAETGETQWNTLYGIKAFSPIAEGYWYSHYRDFGSGRTFGFRRRHLGNDLLGSLGTPIVAVEGGTVEALGWNRYGGWRVGIRSRDRKRYYYYAHLRKDAPYAPGLKEGDTVQARDVIGFMGRTGYSDTENVNNIETVHLHFGMQLIFDESQKDCDHEIWVDVYDIVELLRSHRSTVRYDAERKTWERVYPYRDLDEKEKRQAEVQSVNFLCGG